MKVIDKAILKAMYIGTITKEDAVKALRRKIHIPADILKESMDRLVKNQLVESDKKSLTDLGRSSLRVVLAGGVFDIIHPGHIHTLNAAKNLGDVLVVVVATNKTAVKMKKRNPIHDQKQRKMLVNSLALVDLCVIGHEEDIFKTVDMIRPDTIALGYDQIHQEKFIVDGCRQLDLDIRVARLQSPIPETSSSKIEKEYGEAIHDL